MRLNNIEFLRLLPQFMRDDKNSQAFAYAIQSEIVEVTSAIVHAKIYSRIDSLDETVLDELAWQFNIPEYRNDYDVAVKRSLIKGCMALHYKRGTVAAVEEVIQKIYGDATVEEWFDYGGKPYHFRIRTSNTGATDEMIQEVSRLVKETQSVRAYLEEVAVEIIQSMSLYVGCKAIVMDEVSLQTINVN